MRHAVRGRKLARTSAHRQALRRNLIQSLIEHGELRTTLVKAREIRPMAEKLVTLAVRGGLPARQRAEALLRDRAIIPSEHQADYDRMSDARRERVRRSRSGRRYRATQTRPGIKFTAASVLHKLFQEIGPRMKKRNDARGCAGGYTRIIKLSDRRLGDGGMLAILQFVGEHDSPRPKLTEKTERKRRARVKYSVYAGKPRAQARGPRRPSRSAAAAGEAAAPQPGGEPTSGAVGATGAAEGGVPGEKRE
jgi:large subunit ribosomal protein L17